MKKSLGDKIFVIINIIFFIVINICRINKYEGIVPRSALDKARAEMAIFLISSYFVYTVGKRVIFAFKKNDKSDENENNKRENKKRKKRKKG